MKRIKLNILILIIIFLTIHLGHNYADSQQNQFLVRLKSGVEIFSPNLLIKNGFVFYRFTPSGGKKAGISIKFVKKVFKIMNNGERQTIDIHNPPKSLTKEELVHQ